MARRLGGRLVIQERRLLVVTESLGVGGTESHLVRLLPRLSPLGWKAAIFCISARGERADELESRGVEVLCALGGLQGSQSINTRRPINIARSAASLVWFMRQWRPQIAHFYLPGPYVVGAPIAIAQRVPVKIMSRRSLSVYQQSWPSVAFVERRLHKRMDALVGNSQAVVGQLLEEGAPEDRVKLIYNGVEAGNPRLSRSDARQELGIDGDTLLGIVVANLINYKGHHELIKALGDIKEQLGSNWQILVVGRDQGLQPKLQTLVQIEGVGDNVRFLGQRSDVPSLMAAADFGLLTSHEEGFSNVILEGMRAALPMIVTDVGGNAEAVVNEKTGLVVAARNPRAIGEAILRLSRAPELRVRLGTAAKDRVRQEFSIDRCAAAHADLYQALLASGG
jgi:glycosyltransferase involved in cell wall biosynthesis